MRFKLDYTDCKLNFTVTNENGKIKTFFRKKFIWFFVHKKDNEYILIEENNKAISYDIAKNNSDFHCYSYDVRTKKLVAPILSVETNYKTLVFKTEKVWKKVKSFIYDELFPFIKEEFEARKKFLVIMYNKFNKTLSFKARETMLKVSELKEKELYNNYVYIYNRESENWNIPIIGKNTPNAKRVKIKEKLRDIKHNIWREKIENRRDYLLETMNITLDPQLLQQI